MTYPNILKKIEDTPLTPEINQFIKNREKIRRSNDWERTDTVCYELPQKGFGIIDTPKRHVWKEIKKVGN